MIKNLWRYRYFIISSIRNELIMRFARSKLGGLWTIINPLAQVVIYALILSNVLSARRPNIESKYSFAIYLMAGMLAWSLFSEMINRCLNLFIENGNLIKKIHFPRITLPTIITGYSIVNNILLFASILIIFFLIGHDFSFELIWIIPLAVALATFSLGIGLIIGVINVFVRDLAQAVPIILQIWFWFTPIVYPASVIPDAYRHFFNANPLYHFTNAYQEIIVYGKLPDWEGVSIVAIISIFMLLFGLFLFRRSNEEMVDLL